jgi:hypothetical protein
MTKQITKPIKKIVKPVTNVLGGKSKKQVNAPVDGSNQATTADIKPNDPRLNMSPDQILAERKKKTKTRLGRTQDTSLLYDSNLPVTIG